MGGYARQLSALGYPQRASFSCDDAQQCRYLIVWLELTKIRQWTEEQREALKRVDHPTWSAALQHVGHTRNLHLQQRCSPLAA